MRTKAIAICLLGLALAACSSDKKDAEPEPNVVPTNYRQEILDALTSALDDPTNVREASIGDPELRVAGQSQRYTVCLRYNARDLSRQYAGPQVRIAYFYGGHLNQLIEATAEQCGRTVYKPFPELEKLCLASKCA